jgi:hypothetical protein
LNVRKFGYWFGFYGSLDHELLQLIYEEDNDVERGEMVGVKMILRRISSWRTMLIISNFDYANNMTACYFFEFFLHINTN